MGDWIERETDDAVVSALEGAGFSRLLARLLAGRGVTAETVDAYLAPSIRQFAEPESLPGIVPAADFILQAIADHRRIVVFGDYDCDGVCATAIMIKALSALARDVAPRAFIPNRIDEGYGMTAASLRRLLKEVPDVSLVVTVDNGINAVEAVAALKAHGISVVVTDHHLPGEVLPQADALVDPKVAAPPELDGLCGAGVAYLLANRLIKIARARGQYAGPPIAGPLIVLAGLATVTDVMPLNGQNRILVSEALARFHTHAPLGLQELICRASKTSSVNMTAREFGFLIGPRINAAGRLASGMEALGLILSENRDDARERARQIDLRNVERRLIEQAMADEAMGKVVAGAAAQVIDLPNGHPGIAGIVAARVLEKLGGVCPVCVVAGGHGSARAPSWLNIRDAMAACEETLTRFGGHAAAGGFSVKEGQMDAFRARLCAYCAGFRDQAAAEVGAEYFDAWVASSDLTLDLVEQMMRLSPFGEGNPEPRFAIRGVSFSEIRPLGNDGRHLSVTFRDPQCPRAVWWNHGDLVEELRAESLAHYDILFTLEVSDFGTRHVELRLSGLRKSAS